MRRRPNLKLLVAMLVGLALSSFGVHELHGYQVKRNASSLLKGADRAEARGDEAEANKLRERYLAYVPDDREVLTKYALTLSSDAFARTTTERVQALAVLEKALLRDPGRDDARHRAARLAMDLQQLADARGHLEILLKSAPEDAESEVLLGRCLEAEAKFAEASSRYESARKHRPALVDAYVRQAELLRARLGEPARADRIMDAVEVKDGLIATNGRSSHAYLGRARYRKNYQLAVHGIAADLARAREIDPDDADVIAESALFEREAGRLDEAKALLDRGLAKHPQDVRMYLASSELEVQAGRHEAAIERLEAGERAIPGRHEILWAQAEALIQLHRHDEAGRVIDRLDKVGCPPALRDYLGARIAFDKGEWAAAAAGLEASRVYLVTRPELSDLSRMALFYVGRCQEQLRNPELQLAAYRRAIEATPRGELDSMWVPAHFGMASALASMGRLDEAIEAYRRVAARSPEAKLAALKLLVARELRLESSKRRWTPIEQAFKEAQATLPGSFDAEIQGVEILAGQGNLDAAKALLRTILDKWPDRAEAWVALAVLAARGGDMAGAEAALNGGQAKLGDRVDFRLAWGDLRSSRPGPDTVKSLVALESGLDSFVAADRRRILASLARAHSRAGDAAGAGRLWSSLIAEDPANIDGRLELFDLAFQAGDDAEMERLLGEIRRIEGEDGHLWRFGRARLLIRRTRAQGGVGDLAEARSLLAEAATRRPSWAPIASVQAEIGELEGAPERAMTDYRKAIDLGSKDPALLIRALQSALEQQRNEEADRILGMLKALRPASAELERLESEIALRLRDVARAVASARRLVAARPNSAPELHWLARVLQEWATDASSRGHKSEADGRLEEAIRVARRSVELGPVDPDARVTLVRLLARAGRRDEARAATDRAREDFRWEPSSLLLAVCYDATGQSDLAASVYRAALEAKPDDPTTLVAVVVSRLRSGQMTEALDGLKKLAEAGNRAPREAAWAKRTRAMLLASRGDRKDSLLALGLLDGPDGAARSEESTNDLRARSVVLAMQPERSLRSKAIRSVEELVSRRVASPADRFRLAQLYAGDGEWSKARDAAQELIALDGEKPAYLAFQVEVLRRRGSLDEAGLWLKKLERVQPDSTEVVALKARLAHDRGRDTEATAVLRAYTSAHRDESALVANLLEEIGQFDAAEAIHRAAPIRPSSPEDALALAGFLSRRNRFSEALPIFERAWKTCRPDAVSSSILLALHEASPDARQIQQVSAWIEAAVEKDPSSRTLRFDLANLRCFQNRPAEAEKIFLRVFEEDPSDGTALNNIAWMLANLGRDLEVAIARIDRAIAIHGPTPDLLDTRAMVLIAQGRGEPALKDLDDALAGSSQPILYYHLSRAKFLTGDRRGASEALKKADSSGRLAESLHPLERVAHRKLVADLAGP